jgi:hypothetical protein
MFLAKLNKWILSLVLIANVVAFSGYSESQVKADCNQTELVVERPISKTSVYYFSCSKNSGCLKIDSYEFSFQSLIKNYNLVTGLQIKTSNFICLQYLNKFRSNELLNSLKQDDYYNIFIG